MVSEWSEDDAPEPVVLQFNAHKCHATLLGLTNADGSINLPAILHLPSQGTFRITAPQSAGAKLGYDARRAIGPFVQIVFPPATKETPHVEYHWEATVIYPQLAGIENDVRFDGFRRCWLNVLQVNPRLGVLGNNAVSDTCASCVMECADIAMHTNRIVNVGTGELQAIAPFNDNGQVVPFDRLLSKPAELEVTCELHPWTRAYVIVLDHPYFAITGNAGDFSIDGLPPGTYHLRAWHPVLGLVDQTVTVSGGGTASVAMRLPGENIQAAPQPAAPESSRAAPKA